MSTMTHEALLALSYRAVEVMPQGLVITDASRSDNPIIYCNRGFEELTGYSSAEILNRNCRFLQGQETQPDELQRLRRSINAAVPCTVVLRNYKQDGRPFWNALSVSPIFDDAGTLRHFVGVQTDISAVKDIEEQLLRAQKLETVGLLTGGVAHDFNNLLTVINGFTEMALLEVPDEDAELREMLREVLDAGQRGSALTKQLLGFARTQASPRTAVNLNVVITAADRIIRRLAGSGISVALDLDKDLPAVMADSSQMEQVIFNLVTNAKDATPPGGSVTLRTRKVANANGESVVVLQVSDTGSGMTEETRSRIFEALFTTKAVGRGTGLGLATVQRITDAHRGSIDVKSELGRGTTFSISLPASSSDDAIPLDTGGLRSSHRGTEVLLVVERDDSVRKLLVSSLRALGYTVLEARSGGEAQEVSRSHSGPLHLIVLDIETDDVPVQAVLRNLRSERADVHILLISGISYDDALGELIEAERLLTLSKPFTPEELAKRIRSVLAGPGATPPPASSRTSPDVPLQRA